jgi:gas vesicle protein
MANEERGPGFGTGLILGSIIGALAGIILTPKPGEETRAKVMEKTAGIRQKAEDLTVEARERLRKAIEEGRVVANRMRTGQENDTPDEPSSENGDKPSS